MASTGTTLFLTLHIAPEKLDEFFELFRPLVEKVVAEPECRSFHVYKDPENPGTITIVEHWNATVEWLMNVQIKKEYYKENFEKTEPMFVKPREVRILQPLGPPYDVTKDGNSYGYKQGVVTWS
ncbi:hypothetical protein VTJ49DRAFT_999 [Mycothermus thermophilus]|uniref:ABM domain-containing protein n=1 Tax=Humicola insolens TaxID=85995 RepID=A0ABR3VFL7_HUMIN